MWRSSAGYHLISQHAQPVNLHFDHVPRLEEYRWLAERADPFWCSGSNDVSGLQGDACGSELNQFWDTKNHFARVGVLHRNAVHAGTNGQGMWVRNFIARREIGAGRAESVTRLPADPLPVSELPHPGGDIV